MMIRTPSRLPLAVLGAAVSVACLGVAFTAQASSHREAPFITSKPKVDGTDFYMFRSYGDDADTDSVTLIANYSPLQDSYGGPNYFQLDPNAVYEIHIDNDGDAVEDITFQFRFSNNYDVPAVEAGGDTPTTVPLVNIGDASNPDNLSVIQRYTVDVINGDRRSDSAGQLTDTDGGGSQFTKPLANIGGKSFPNGYEDYANGFIYDVSIPGCADGSTAQGRLFVGQRKEGFVVNLGELFDLVNQNGDSAPLQTDAGGGGYARDAGQNIIADKNITSLALQVPTSCLTTTASATGGGTDSMTDEDGNNGTSNASIGAWTTASLPQAEVLNPAPQSVNRGPDITNAASVRGGPFTQVSRLGSPLVNEVVIGLDQKDRFNASEPVNDPQFLQFVTNPSLPVLIDALFDVGVPDTPRNDLVAAFLTGLNLTAEDGTVVFNNQVGSATPGEMLRLNTSIDPVPLAQQNSLGLLACDTSGFPNGRRPFDDITDIELNAAEGAVGDNPLELQTCDVSSGTPTVVNEGRVVNDGALPARANYDSSFPYLQTPIPGSPNEDAEAAASVEGTLGTDS